MDVQAAKEFLERRSVDDLQSIVVLAQFLCNLTIDSFPEKWYTVYRS